MPKAELRPEQIWSQTGMVVTALCFVLNMLDGVNIFTLTYVAPQLQAWFGVGPEQFGLVFSAGLAGMAIGGITVAPLADRWGRRPIIIGALLLMAVAMIASGFAPDLAVLALVRVAVGIGIGTVLASITALSAGFAPDRMRAVATGVPQAGYPLAAMITGFVLLWALPRYGWSAVFVSAGVLTLAFVPVCWFALPEAPRQTSAAPVSIIQAIGGKRRRNSLLLWLCTIGGFMALYFIGSWITKLAIEAGLPPAQAIIASAIYNLGAFVGTVALSFAATRVDVRKLIAAMLCAAAALFLVFGGVHMPLGWLLLVSFLIGVTLQGGVNGNYPLVASVYPAQARATGLGWAMGIGRIGAVLGPAMAGAALGAGLPLVMVFGIFCVPLLITGAAALAVRLDQP